MFQKCLTVMEKRETGLNESKMSVKGGGKKELGEAGGCGKDEGILCCSMSKQGGLQGK